MAKAKPKPWDFLLQHTLGGKPYLTISESGSESPIFLTELYEHDVEAMAAALNIEAIERALIAIPWPYTEESARWWIGEQT